MAMRNQPRPGIWGDQALPGEIIRIDEDGSTIINLGATFISLWGQNHKKRREYRLE